MRFVSFGVLVLIDMFTAELSGTQRLSALEAMESQGGKYDSKLIGDLYAFTAPLARRRRRQLALRKLS